MVLNLDQYLLTSDQFITFNHIVKIALSKSFTNLKRVANYNTVLSKKLIVKPIRSQVSNLKLKSIK